MPKKLLTGADVNSQKIINLADGSAASDAATKGQLDAAIRGVTWKPAVRAASTANVTIATPGTSLDGVTLAANDRVLLKNQTTGGENGIYVWTASGTPLTRALDADSSAELVGAAVLVMEGTANANTAWTQNVDAPITLGTTALTWAQLGGGVTILAGNGLSGTSTFVVLADPVTGGGIIVSSSGVKVDPSIFVRKYAVNCTTSNPWVVTHNLGTLDVTYLLVEVATGIVVDADVVLTSTNVVTVTLAAAPTSGQYRIVIHA